MTSEFRVGDLVLDKHTSEVLWVREISETCGVRAAATPTSYGFWAARPQCCFTPIARVQPLRKGIQRLIDDLDRARADGSIYTYGEVQRRLRDLLEGERR